VSQYPTAINPEMVGEYDLFCHSGAGYFYDEVLEYRVWCHPERGAPDEFDGDDYCNAFETYEEALAFSQSTNGAEKPLVLIRQLESINEPQPAVFEHFKVKRITEWQVEWLEGTKRESDSIANFLAEKNKSGKSK
jgi:hypothetical protein